MTFGTTMTDTPSIGTRVRSTMKLGLMRERGWRSKFYCNVPSGTTGTVIELEDALSPRLVAEGWFAVRFDGFERVPEDDLDWPGDVLFCAAHAQFVSIIDTEEA